MTYSPDGAWVLAGGRSKYVCLYSTDGGVLVKKYELSHNRYMMNCCTYYIAIVIITFIDWN